MIAALAFVELLLATGAESRNHLPEGVKKESGKTLVVAYPYAVVTLLLLVVLLFICYDSCHRLPGGVKKEPG